MAERSDYVDLLPVTGEHAVTSSRHRGLPPEDRGHRRRVVGHRTARGRPALSGTLVSVSLCRNGTVVA